MSRVDIWGSCRCKYLNCLAKRFITKDVNVFTLFIHLSNIFSLVWWVLYVVSLLSLYVDKCTLKMNTQFYFQDNPNTLHIHIKKPHICIFQEWTLNSPIKCSWNYRIQLVALKELASNNTFLKFLLKNIPSLKSHQKWKKLCIVHQIYTIKISNIHVNNPPHGFKSHWLLTKKILFIMPSFTLNNLNALFL